MECISLSSEIVCEGQPAGMHPRKVLWSDWDEENQWRGCDLLWVKPYKVPI